MSADLFSGAPTDAARPLADRLRPSRLEDVAGQDHLLTGDAPLSRMIARGRLSSLILWGPPGVGKTTMARLLADAVGAGFEELSAIGTGVAELKKTFQRLRDQGAVLFVDEIHRFNRAQQDVFLPEMETGAVTLIGATTENPSFALNAALLSRAQVLRLNRLDDAALETVLARAEAALGAALPLTPDARAALLRLADGDGRALIALAEELSAVLEETDSPLDEAALAARLSRRVPVYDRDQDGHYGLISALHKAVRASDPDAALYWLCRMLQAGEDPLFLARRLVRMASEDIGLADPDALPVAIAAREAYQFLGPPEGELALAQAAVHLAMAPKSNALYTAFKAAARAAEASGSAPPQAHSVNAPTALMRKLGAGRGYRYDHDAPDGFAGQDHFPESVGRTRFYAPVERGFEREMRRRLAFFEKRRAEIARDDDDAP